MPEILVGPEDIDLKADSIDKRYHAIIHKSPDWTVEEKKRVIAMRETSRLINEEATKKTAKKIASIHTHTDLETRLANIEAFIEEVKKG